jgi:serine/threonine protein phosphatase PrpC
MWTMTRTIFTHYYIVSVGLSFTARSSGTTVTFVIIDGLVITVASVGDSRCVLQAEGSIYHLSSDHRFDASKEE